MTTRLHARRALRPRNTLLRAAWGAALEETRVPLLDVALATDEQLRWEFA